MKMLSTLAGLLCLLAAGCGVTKTKTVTVGSTAGAAGAALNLDPEREYRVPSGSMEPTLGPALMHLRSLSAAAGFATGLLAIYFVPTGGWPLEVVLVLAVSLLGGYMIGQWWAVGVALGSNIVFSALYLFAYDDLSGSRQITIRPVLP